MKLTSHGLIVHMVDCDVPNCYGENVLYLSFAGEYRSIVLIVAVYCSVVRGHNRPSYRIKPFGRIGNVQAVF